MDFLKTRTIGVFK